MPDSRSLWLNLLEAAEHMIDAFDNIDASVVKDLPSGRELMKRYHDLDEAVATLHEHHKDQGDF